MGLVIFDKDGTLIELYHYWSQMVALRARLICEALGLGPGLQVDLRWALGVDEKTGRLLTRPEDVEALRQARRGRPMSLDEYLTFLRQFEDPPTTVLRARRGPRVERPFEL